MHSAIPDQSHQWCERTMIAAGLCHLWVEAGTRAGARVAEKALLNVRCHFESTPGPKGRPDWAEKGKGGGDRLAETTAARGSRFCDVTAWAQLLGLSQTRRLSRTRKACSTTIVVYAAWLASSDALAHSEAFRTVF